jgi:threonine dehydrogenase-like Zn-dependent dehydrogenase
VLVSQVIGPRKSEVVELADPEPRPGEVLVDVVASGVCTSDLSPWRSGGTPAAPIRLGHEIVGRVRHAGSTASGWNPGDLVTGLGGNGFATAAVLEASSILSVPAGIAPELAIGEPIADLEEALARTHPSASDRVAVVGLGFMGLGLIQLAKTRAPSLLVGVDPSPAARQRALALGADLVFHPDELPAELSSETSREREARMNIVLEATGATPGLETAGSLVRPFGTLCVVGYHHAGTALMDMKLWYRAATIVNGFCPDRTRLMAAMRDAMGLIASHRVSYAPLITHRFALDQVDEAYQLMERRDDDFVKSVILF